MHQFNDTCKSSKNYKQICLFNSLDKKQRHPIVQEMALSNTSLTSSSQEPVAKTPVLAWAESARGRQRTLRIFFETNFPLPFVMAILALQ